MLLLDPPYGFGKVAVTFLSEDLVFERIVSFVVLAGDVFCLELLLLVQRDVSLGLQMAGSTIPNCSGSLLYGVLMSSRAAS